MIRVGLVRHFRVRKDYPRGLISRDEVISWINEYEETEIDEGNPYDLGDVDWQRCYASDIARAKRTAEIIYRGDIVTTEKLREIKYYPTTRRNVRLPFLAWAILMRIAIMKPGSNPFESTADIKQRASAILDEVLAQGEGNVLLVSHGAIMLYLRKELLRRGFTGPKLGTPENGKMYLFTR